MQAIEAIVLQRFDHLGLRIWRCLFLQGQLEQRSIKDLVLGDQKVEHTFSLVFATHTAC